MPGISTYSLAPFTGEFDRKALQHLLRRSLFGVGHRELAAFEGKEIGQCLHILLKQSPAPPPPVMEASEVIDPLVPKGQVWVKAPYENQLLDNRRGIMLKMWWVGRILNRDYSLTEKMTLFWHNHFVTEMDVVKDSRYSYTYAAMLHLHSLGNFKKLIRDGTTNIAMLVYLNGNSNNKDAPNENYARELMELFTLGKGAGVNYTESDVKAVARVLSGWKDDKETIRADFYPSLHDTGDKQFSSFFENKVIIGKKGNDGAREIDELVEMIFKRKETAKFVCRNLYRWFVTSHIDGQTEQKVIEPLAEIFIQNNFEIIPVLRALLGSEHFFDPAFRGCIVKSPTDFFLGAMQQFDAVSTAKLDVNHETWVDFYTDTADLSMDIGNPPSVAGWPAYYQEPKFHQWWINSATLNLRSKYLSGLCTRDGVVFNGTTLKLDFLHFAHQFRNASNADDLIDEFTTLLFAVNIEQSIKDRFRALLLSGLQGGQHWTDAWNKCATNPNDVASKNIVENALRLLVKNIISMPEYQMM